MDVKKIGTVLFKALLISAAVTGAAAAALALIAWLFHFSDQAVGAGAIVINIAACLAGGLPVCMKWIKTVLASFSFLYFSVSIFTSFFAHARTSSLVGPCSPKAVLKFPACGQSWKKYCH